MCSVNTTLEINVLAQHVSTQESHHQAEYLRTIRPGTKEGTLQKGQEPNPTDHCSEGAY